MTEESQLPDDGGDNKPPRKRIRDRIKKPRFRFTYIWIIGLLVIGLSLLTDPDTGLIRGLPFGAGTVAQLVILSKVVIYQALLHFTRKGLMDYFDMEEAWEICKQDPRSAGYYVIGAGLYTVAQGIVFIAAVIR